MSVPSLDNLNDTHENVNIVFSMWLFLSTVISLSRRDRIMPIVEERPRSTYHSSEVQRATLSG